MAHMSATLVVRPLEPRAFDHSLDRVQARQLVATLVYALEAGLEHAGRAVVMLDPSGGVMHAGTVARALLDSYFPGSDLARLPRLIARRLDRLEDPLTIRSPRGRLVVRRIDLDDRAVDVLLLEEHRDCVLDMRSLRRLGLTARQAQILGLVARGRQTEEIADELRISPRTVNKHVERVRSCLGVSSRGAAVAEAMRRAPSFA
jgi:DNA-binding CsgD family transcriptional regulator